MGNLKQNMPYNIHATFQNIFFLGNRYEKWKWEVPQCPPFLWHCRESFMLLSAGPLRRFTQGLNQILVWIEVILEFVCLCDLPQLLKNHLKERNKPSSQCQPLPCKGFEENDWGKRESLSLFWIPAEDFAYTFILLQQEKLIFCQINRYFFPENYEKIILSLLYVW